MSKQDYYRVRVGVDASSVGTYIVVASSPRAAIDEVLSRHYVERADPQSDDPPVGEWLIPVGHRRSRPDKTLFSSQYLRVDCILFNWYERQEWGLPELE